LIFPVPFVASWICGFGIIGGRKDADTLTEVVPSKAAHAISCFGIPSVTVIAHSLANAIRIKVGPFSAGNAALVVPGLAQGIFCCCEGSLVNDAISSRVKHISTIAGSALTVRNPGVAKVRNWGADLLGVEVKSGRTGEAVVVAVPSEAARIDLLL